MATSGSDEANPDMPGPAKPKVRRHRASGHSKQEKLALNRQTGLAKWTKWRAEGRDLTKMLPFGYKSVKERAEMSRQNALKRWARWRAEGGVPAKVVLAGRKNLEEFRMRRKQTVKRCGNVAEEDGREEKMIKELPCAGRLTPGQEQPRRASVTPQETLTNTAGNGSSTDALNCETSDGFPDQGTTDVVGDYEVERIIAVQKVDGHVYSVQSTEFQDPAITTRRKLTATNPRILTPEGVSWLSAKKTSNYGNHSDREFG